MPTSQLCKIKNKKTILLLNKIFAEEHYGRSYNLIVFVYAVDLISMVAGQGFVE